MHHQFRLRAGREGLGYVEIHFVTVEIGVVGGGAAQVETEGAPIEDFAGVAHDTHFV